ncbi:FtsX-like permease family protein [Prevotella sp. 10(H)]|uniref:ABC transporter permease n=1 Tax=Prevotella sp. 10(H) TaxID=1158294 RepID=UPI000A8F8479
MKPTEFDTNHVYRININEKESTEDNNSDAETYTIWSILDRIKQYPEIENASLSLASIPYSASYWGGSVFLDTVDQGNRMKHVTPEYFEVFKIKIEHGQAFNWDDIVGENIAVISGDENDNFMKMPAKEVKKFVQGRLGDTADAENTYKVCGVATKAKWSEYADYEPVVYYPLKKDDERLGTGELCVRVKPEADKDFAKRFTKNMQNQLSLGQFYLSSVQSMNDIRDSYMKGWEYDNNLKSIYSISAFILINIFLGVVGTFWFRTQARRSEISLRIALGASRKNVKSMFIGETLILLFIASILATIICINISLVDVLQEIGVPSINREQKSIDIFQYFINYGTTLGILAIIAVAGVWYPAWRASKTQPAIALRDE